MDMLETARRDGRCVEIDVINLEGTLAVGKSTLLRLIADDPEELVRVLSLNGINVPKAEASHYDYCCVVEEPLARWTAVGARKENLLAAAYRGDAGSALACQLNVVSTRLRAIAAAIKDIFVCNGIPYGTATSNDLHILVVTERSTSADFAVFATSAYDRKMMSDAEWHVYAGCWTEAHAAWRARIAKLCFYHGYKTAHVRCTATVVLVLSADVAHKRIKARGRDYESQLTRADIAAIAELTQRVFVRERTKYGLTHRRVVCVNALALHDVLSGRAKPTLLMKTTLQPDTKRCTCPLHY